MFKKIFTKNSQSAGELSLLPLSGGDIGRVRERCRADGVEIGAPVQRVAFDPLAIETLRGGQLPVEYPLAEPKLTDHLFFIKVPAGCRRLEVEATDGSGEVFRESISLG